MSVTEQFPMPTTLEKNKFSKLLRKPTIAGLAIMAALSGTVGVKDGVYARHAAASAVTAAKLSAVPDCQAVGPWDTYVQDKKFDSQLSHLVGVTKENLYGGSYGVADCNVAISLIDAGKKIDINNVGLGCVALGPINQGISFEPNESIMAYCLEPVSSSKDYKHLYKA